MNIGEIIDNKYELVRLLGEGGIGAVYEGRHLLLGTRVALKFLHADLTHQSELVTRFLNEALAAARLGSVHIINLYDFGRTKDGVCYLVMEYLDGRDLGWVVRREGPFSPERAASLVIQSCRGLAYAHEQGIIHRDIKPENLFVTRLDDKQEWIKIVDFGIAKFRGALESIARDHPNLTIKGSAQRTFCCMSPEQVRLDSDVDHRIDIYSMGVVLYELLVGRPPFNTSSFDEMLIMIVTATFPRPRDFRPELPEALEGVILKAMAGDRDFRYSTAHEFIEALAPFAPAAAQRGGSVSLRDREPALELGLTQTGLREDASGEAYCAPAKSRIIPPPVSVILLISFLLGIAVVVSLSYFLDHHSDSTVDNLGVQECLDAGKQIGDPDNCDSDSNSKAKAIENRHLGSM